MPEPYSKESQLATGRPRRYRRKVASAKQWQALRESKGGPCRVCDGLDSWQAGTFQLHHVVPRGRWMGDDVADNLVPLCRGCHEDVTCRDPAACLALCSNLSDGEYAYAVGKCGESFWERAYGVGSVVR